MIDNRRTNWLDRALIGGAAVVLVVLGFLAFTVLAAVLSVAALVLAVRWWWISRKLKDEKPLTLDGDYRVVPRPRSK
jgi:hypothetical protein